ncbi:membrane protein [Amylibacter marinus]|uniref:Membrane protein n=1 Tax=Amylibacter marinus TaxID=1475483 RepID=A0ABQ5VWL7_9RHOB|nr:DMT family transporter [Amylibacter marinus]GLQ35673.1 membrane protein [Amylibacter marinus]
MGRKQATAVGGIAILLWALLALFTVGSVPVPPFQLNAICFGIGGVLGLIYVGATGGFSALYTISWRIYAFGTLGLFGYHFLYFSALRMAPAAEAGLIAYLWPLLIVLYSGLLPSETLRRGHIIGAVLGFLGAGLLVAGGGVGFETGAIAGYVLALVAANVWTGYSVISRRLGDVATASVAVFCLCSAVLSTLAHFTFEVTAWPSGQWGWASIIGLGIGPVGLAFYVWDVGVKRGDIQLLGTLSYGAPLLSTAALVLAGFAEASMVLVLAAVLITLGAVIAARAR